MKVLVTGASGLIGSQLATFLSIPSSSLPQQSKAYAAASTHIDARQADGSTPPLPRYKSSSSAPSSQGHTVIPLSLRGLDDEDELAKKLDNLSLNAVVHLAGESIAERWTEEKMLHIKESRINGTNLLYQALAKIQRRPQTLICASAIGYYGNRNNESLNEQSSKGDGFLANLCAQWEQTQNKAASLGIRVVNMRFGVVLSKHGGALSKMLLPFQLGAGGIIGNGQQYMSWIDIDDVTGAIYHALTNNTLTGPVNVVSPHAVTNQEFTKVLGKVLCRPTLIPIPSFGLRMLFGAMADELLISGQNVIPAKLQASGYQFQYPDLEPSLRHVLNQK